MMTIFFVVLFSFINVIHFCEGSKYDAPPMYLMDNYRRCHDTNGTYCVFEFKIRDVPHRLNSLWKTIQESQNNPMKLDRSVLNRMICVPLAHGNEKQYFAQRTIGQELLGIDVNIDVIDIDCEREWNFPYYRTVLWLCLGAYLATIFLATIYHRQQTAKPHPPVNKYEEWLGTFSIIRNAKKLWTQNSNPDFQRLKSIQGIRVINTAIVVLFHSVLSLFQTYVDDIDELEKSFENPVVFYLMFLGAFSVQFFFMISTFLLTNQIYDLQTKHGNFTLRHCSILIFNRIFRFVPTLLVVLALTRTDLYEHCPHTVKILNNSVPMCQKYWWLTLLQINFLLPFDKICTPGYWYISIDTLFFVCTLFILYLVLKYKWHVGKFVGGLMLLIIIFFAGHIYVNSYDFMFQPYPKTLKNLLNSKAIHHVYAPPIASWSSSLIGLMLGHVYYHNKQNQLICVKVKELQTIWGLTFACIPMFILHLSTYSYHGLFGSIVGALLKPLFVLPIGVGVLGMAFGLGGIVKSFLESDVLFFLSNVTYCTYIFHFFIVFAKGLFLTELLVYKTYHLVFWIIFDVVISFILGTICTICIEYPGLALQKKYLPQIGTKSNKKN